MFYWLVFVCKKSGEVWIVFVGVGEESVKGNLRKVGKLDEERKIKFSLL